MVAFEVFGRPAIMKMLGKTDWRRPVVRAIAEERIANVGDPRVFMARCVVTEREGRHHARLAGSQSSGVLTSLARANGLTLIPAEVDVIEAGSEVDVMMLDWSHGEEWGSRPTGG
jgi:molybdopterin molybdotransferase